MSSTTTPWWLEDDLPPAEEDYEVSFRNGIADDHDLQSVDNSLYVEDDAILAKSLGMKEVVEVAAAPLIAAQARKVSSHSSGKHNHNHTQRSHSDKKRRSNEQVALAKSPTRKPSFSARESRSQTTEPRSPDRLASSVPTKSVSPPSSPRPSPTTTTAANNRSSSKWQQVSATLAQTITQLSQSIREQWKKRFSQNQEQQQQQQHIQQHNGANGTRHSPSSREVTQSTRSRSITSESSASSSSSPMPRYTIQELIQGLGRPDVELPPALERRVRDFKFAQQKRRDRHGEDKPWGIFGLYAHLSDIRADLEWAEDAAWRRQRQEPYLSWTDFEKTRDKGLKNRPWFTYGVIAICSIMLVVTFGVNGWKMEPLNINPLIGPSSETLVQVGARQTDMIVNEGQWFRLFTPLVLHAGLVHFVINMMAMYFIGGAVEQSHGFASAAVLFILPAVGGNILSAICLPQYISVGASGGIFGLIGACLADISLNWNLLFLKSTTDQESRWRHFMVLFWLAFDIIINCIIGFTPFVDNFTHLGGFLYGFCCGLSTIERLGLGFFGLQTSKTKSFWRFFGLVASVIAILVTTVFLVQSDGITSPCHGCRYISCVPFPPRAEDKWWYCDDCDFVQADLFVNGAGSGLYEEIELTCPNGQVESIAIADDGLYDKEDVREKLPTYCREFCDGVFFSQ